MADPRICSVTECGNNALARGWCAKHYYRWLRHGDPLGGRATFDGEPATFYRNVVLTYEGDDCLIWPFGRSDNGYGVINGGRRSKVVSRRVCEDEHGPAPSPAHHAAHSCGNGHKGCVNRRHIDWKLPVENSADQARHGTQVRGSRQHASRLTEDQVRLIRRQLASGEQTASIARSFSVTPGSIRDIARGKNWGWLT